MRELRIFRLKTILVCSSIGLAAACSSSDTDKNPAGGAGQNSTVSGSGGSTTATAGTTAGGAGTTTNTGGSTAPRAGSGGTSGGTSGSGSAGTTPPAGGAGGAGGTTAPPVADADSWRMMGYDSTNTYFNPAEKTISAANAGTLVEKWRFMVSGYPPGSAVIAEGKVFVMASGGTYGLDLAAGTMIWARMDLTGTASMAYDNGFVYAHTAADAMLWKLKASDGTTVWGPVKTYDLSDCDGMSSPIIAGGKVVVGHSCGVREIGAGYAEARGGVEAFDAETGMKAWTYWSVPKDGTEDGAMTWSTVTIDAPGNTVYAATGNNYSVAGPNSDSIHAIDLATGTGKWKKQVRQNDVWSLVAATLGDDTDFGANPILATVGGKAVVANGDKGSAFWSLDRATGNIEWSRENLSASHSQANGGVLNAGGFDGQYFYTVSNDPTGNTCTLHKMDGATGVSMWMKTYPTVTWGALSIANGVLYVAVNADMYVINAADGATLKMFATGGTIAAGAPAVAQGRVIVKSGLQYVFGGASAINNNAIIAYGLP